MMKRGIKIPKNIMATRMLKNWVVIKTVCISLPAIKYRARQTKKKRKGIKPPTHKNLEVVLSTWWSWLLEFRDKYSV